MAKIAFPRLSKKVLLGAPAIFLTVSLCLFWQELIAASPLFFGYRGNDVWGVYSASLDGKQFRAVMVDPVREISHARLSPDRKHLTFTRYNKVVKDGLCEENGSGYAHTEVCIADFDEKKGATNLLAVDSVGPQIMNANSSWIDNDSIVYIHKEATALPELRIYNLSSRKSRRLPTKAGLAVSDPTCVGSTIVFPIVPLNEKDPCSLWTMNLDGTGLRQLTDPTIKATDSRLDFKLGDYDPWLSPGGDAVTFMRYFGGMDWRVFTVSMKDGLEKQITKTGIPSGIPKWSSDGRTIAYVCWDKSKLENLGLYTISPGGQERRKIPLPAGYLYTHPSFFPGSSSLIMLSARRVPGLPK